MTDFSDLTIIFDLDGTLVDTAPDLLATLNFILEREGHDLITLDDTRNMVGQGARALLDEGFRKSGTALGDQELDRLMQDFITYYSAHIADHSVPFEGIVDLIKEYKSAGAKIGVCTNKLEGLSRLLLKALELDGLMDCLVGRDTTAAAKPDPLPLREAVRLAGGTMARAIYIGDSITDVLTARAAEVPIVLVSFGYTLTPASELGGDVLIDHFSELTDAIEEVMT